MSFDLDGYVDVATRMTEFFEKYPDGSLRQHSPPEIVEVSGKAFVIYTAAAYRTPDDEAPGIGTAWEPVPGKTPYTKDSELMNAETSAWGRAILAVGAASASSGVASKQEVRNRQGGQEKPAQRSSAPSEKQVAYARSLASSLGDAATTVVPSIIEEETGRKAKLGDLTKAEMTKVIDALKPLAEKAEVEIAQREQDKAERIEAGVASGEEPWT